MRAGLGGDAPLIGAGALVHRADLSAETTLSNTLDDVGGQCLHRAMHHVISADGTRLAVHDTGSGPPS